MAKDYSNRLLSTLYGDDLDEFYRNNSLEIASNATDEEGEIITASLLSGSRDKNMMKLIFPSIRERKIENLAERGLFSLDSSLIASYYPLLGKDVVVEWSITLSDVVKATLSLICIKELYLNERRMRSFFTSASYYALFPSLDAEKIDLLTDKLLANLYELRILEKEGRRLRFDKKKAFELCFLDDIRLASYIIFPSLDEWVRKRSFYFIHLLKKLKGIEKDRIKEYVHRVSVISAFQPGEVEELFTFLLLKEDGGLVFSPSDEKSSGPVLISSDYSITFEGPTPSLIAALAEPERIDRVKTYRISKEGILNAFSLSYTDKELISYLESVSDFSLSETLSSRIEIWQKEYSRISLERALVLRTDKKIAKVLKSLPEMGQYILEEIADGIFIMDSMAEEEWRAILKNASFDMLPPTKGPEFNYSCYSTSSPFIELPSFSELNEERRIPYDGKRRNSLLSKVSEKEPMLRLIKEMMISSGIIFSEEQLKKQIGFESADAFSYMDKHRLLEKALKDKSLAAVVENHSGKTAVGKIEMLESFEDGDHMILSHKVLSVSRLYRCALLPASFL